MMNKPKWFSIVQKFYEVVGILILLSTSGVVWAGEIGFIQKVWVVELIIFGICSLAVAKSLSKFTQSSLRISLFSLLIFIVISFEALMYTPPSEFEQLNPTAVFIQSSLDIGLISLSTFLFVYILKIISEGEIK